MDLTNILVFRIGHLGDILVSLPALWTLRRTFPTSRLSLLTNVDRQNPHYVSAASVLPQKGLLDDFIAYPTGLEPFGRTLAFLMLASELRQRKIDSMIYLMPRMRTAKQIARDRRFFRVCGVSELVGSEFLLRNRLDLPNPGTSKRVESEAEFLLRLLGEIGVPSKAFETDVLLTEGEISTAQHWLISTMTGQGHGPSIAVAPGAKWESKIWDEERFLDVVATLIREYDCSPIVFGGVEDRGKGQRMIERWGRGANAAGSLGVREAAALLKECDLYLGNDTGTMHLAATVGTPCVAIFTSLDWVGKWEPFGENNRIFRSGFKCSGCELGQCVNQKRCLDLIETEKVYLACSGLLDDRQACQVLSSVNGC